MGGLGRGAACRALAVSPDTWGGEGPVETLPSRGRPHHPAPHGCCAALPSGRCSSCHALDPGREPSASDPGSAVRKLADRLSCRHSLGTAPRPSDAPNGSSSALGRFSQRPSLPALRLWELQPGRGPPGRPSLVRLCQLPQPRGPETPESTQFSAGKLESWSEEQKEKMTDKRGSRHQADAASSWPRSRGDRGRSGTIVRRNDGEVLQKHQGEHKPTRVRSMSPEEETQRPPVGAL